MELNKFHVRDGDSGAPCHGYPVARRNRRIRGVEIDLPASPSSQHHPIASYRLNFARFLIERVKSEAPIFRCETKLGGGDQIDRGMVFQQLHPRRSAERRQ